MDTETKTPKIYDALIKANELVGAISKGNTNQQQGFKFRGVDDVYNRLHPILAKCGIVIIPEVVSYEVTERQARNGVLLYTRATIRHHFTTSDGSSVTTLVVGEAMDSGDKGMNKAMSIALKYALFQLFTIPTDEDKDPDATTHELVPQATQATTSLDYQSKVEGAINELAKANSLDELANIFRSLPKEMQDDRSVKGEATRLKAVFAQKTEKK
jgi:hypothetical protein|nr:MAG TPA: ERF superfamily protein [Caudoviricetes sp.]